MLHDVSLADRFDLTKERVQLSGSQAIVRLVLMQRARDAAMGHDTAGYITGYRGSPLGGLDQQFHSAGRHLKPAGILFQPALNEDIGAAALWGTQQAEIRGEGRHQGVFGLWYGKGPGVDRSGDVLRHANLAGTSPLGGVIALMGDDHTCESSTTAHQSEFAFVDAMIPILSPAGVQELIDFGLHGWALSRFSGLWVGIKCVKDTVESTATVDVSPGRFAPVPVVFDMPPGGLGIRTSDHPNAQEERLHRYKIDAALAYLRAQRLDRVVHSGGERPRIGIVSAGKSFLDVEQAFQELGLDAADLARLGVSSYKVACTWPLEPQGMRAFCEGLDLVIVVEEKRSLIEAQIRDILYALPSRPQVIGKIDEDGHRLLQTHGALDVNDIAIAIGRRIAALDGSVGEQLRMLDARQSSAKRAVDIANRTPYFCAGCPHNSSTVVPDGSRAYAGIGCHYMSQWMDRSTEGHTHMGGEGANWIGEAHFSKRDHIFQNMGDGTYNHSGLLAIRAAKASGVNITYKILFNDAVAMTGGQRHEGGLTVDAVTRQVAAEGANRIALVTDDPDKYTSDYRWPEGLTIHHRADLDAVQRSLRDVKGLSVLVYDQTCAAERRRRRKRGEMDDPAVRVFINDLVCEGCGDCSVKSNCVAVVPLETELGRKRTIDQSACNKDKSCIQGFCPSFVTIEGGKLKVPSLPKRTLSAEDPMPGDRDVVLDRPYSIVLTGVGGTGVVTIGALIAMAAHVEGKGSAIIDMAGLAQKGGAVMSHIRLAPRQDDIKSVRVAAGGADLLLACDVVIAGTQKALATIAPGKTKVVLNTYLQYPGDLTRNPDLKIPDAKVRQEIDRVLSKEAVSALNATTIAQEHFGDGMFGNVLLLGYAYQRGAVPLSAVALERAIELNGSAVARNIEAFRLGRRLAAQERVEAEPDAPLTLAHFIDHRAAFLTQYQNAAYAKRYRDAVDRVIKAEAALGTGSEKLSMAVATNLFRLMAYKDEYEVARLYTSTGFVSALRANFEGDVKVKIYLAPPGLTRTDQATDRPRKIAVGSWILPIFRILAAAKGLRGTRFDPFGYTQERRTERALVDEYFATIDELCSRLSPANLDLAVTLAATPEKIRGYGHIKERAVENARRDFDARMADFRRAVEAATPRT